MNLVIFASFFFFLARSSTPRFARSDLVSIVNVGSTYFGTLVSVKDLRPVVYYIRADFA